MTHFFTRTETNRRPWAEHVQRPSHAYAFDVEGDTVEELLAAAQAQGMPKGSSRSGCFEIQCEAGIWQRRDGRQWGKLTSANAVLKTWEQLEAEERRISDAVPRFAAVSCEEFYDAA